MDDSSDPLSITLNFLASNTSDTMRIVLILLLIAILTFINGFFSASEMAIVSIRKEKIQNLIEKGNKRAKMLENIVREPTNFFSAIQVAITLAGFLSSAIAGNKLSSATIALFSKLNLVISEELAIVLVTLLLSYFTLVFGELIPKRIAFRNPEKVAIRSVVIIRIFMAIVAPFVKLLSFTTNSILRLFGHKKQTDEEKVSEELIKSMIIAGHTEGLFDEEGKEMLDSIFKFDDVVAESIMTPRIDVFAIDVSKNIKDYLDQIIDEGFSRIPVYDGDIDNIIGILHVKDILSEASKVGFDNIDLKKIIREPYFVPSYIKINLLFKNMKETNNQIAVLIDEYGGSEGIVTLEDLIEEIVGNIYDEYDLDDNKIQKLENDKYLVDASIQIQDLNRSLKIHIPDDSEEYDTLNGLITYLLGFIPDNDYEDEIEFENLSFKINKLSENKIDQVILEIKPEIKIEEE